MKSIQHALLSVLAAMLCTITVKAQDSWYLQFGGDNYQRIRDAKRDAENNWILCGYFRESMDADPGTGEFTLNAGTYEDIFVVKLNEAGDFVWAFNIGSGHQDFAYKLELDAAGNIVIAGTFQGEVDFDPGAGTAMFETAGAPFNSSNMYVAKYTSNGEFISAYHFRTLNENETSNSTSIAVDPDGNLLVAGTISGSVDIDPSGDELIFEMDNDFGDIVVAKLNPGGQLIWAYHFEGPIGDGANDVAVDNEGNVYITGLIRSTVDFDPGPGVAELSPQGDDTFNDIFILSLTSDGGFRWAKGIGTSNAQDGLTVDVGPDGAIYAAGRFNGAVNFNPGGSPEIILEATSTDIYLMKLSAAGEVAWAKSWGGPGSESNVAVEFGPDNEIITTGFFAGNIYLEAELPGTELSSAGGTDIFVLTHSPAGELQHAFSVGGEGDEFGYFCTLDSDGTHYVLAGIFDDVVVLEPGNPASELVPVDESDAFFARIDPNWQPVNILHRVKTGNYVYPNPATTTIVLESIDLQNIQKITLLDASGIPVKEWKQPEQELLLNGLTPGMYLLIIDSHAGRQVQKLVME